MKRAPKAARPVARTRRAGDSSKPPTRPAAGEAWLELAGRLTSACEGLAREAPRLVESLQQLSARDRPATASVPPRVRRQLEEAAARMDSARRTLVGALDTLPRDPDYAAVARQLRELATVSPSLMDWLKQVPKVSTPLAASAKGLQDAAVGLESARDGLEAAIRELWPEG